MKGNIEELTVIELKKSLEDSKKRVFELRFKSVTSKVANVKEISHLKKKIARILTLMNMRDIKN